MSPGRAIKATEITKIRPILGAGWVKDPARGDAISWFDDVRIGRVDDALYDRLIDRPVAPTVSVSKINAEKYRVQVRGAKAPFVLVQSESFDPLWVARLADGGEVEPVPMYATINGYPINRTGDFDLVLEYRPQRYFLYGLALSLTTLFLCLLYILYAWKGREGPVGALGHRVFTVVAAVALRSWDAARRRLDEPPGGRPRRRRGKGE
jgi:hypothetical protein